MKKNSTLFLISLYIGSIGRTKQDARAEHEVADELERRGIITLTPNGTQWHFNKLSGQQLMVLEDDMRGKHETVGMFRYNIDQFLNGR